MGTLVHVSNVSLVDIPHFYDEITVAEKFIKKGRLAHHSGESRSWPSNYLTMDRVSCHHKVSTV